jgi:hypothetical protein
MRIIGESYPKDSSRACNADVERGRAMEGGSPQPYPNARSGLALRPRTVVSISAEI